MTTRRKGSAEAMASIPHTRLQDEGDIASFYELGTKLGQGSFGKVHEATHIKSGERRAIKSINKEKVREPTALQSQTLVFGAMSESQRSLPRVPRKELIICYCDVTNSNSIFFQCLFFLFFLW